MTDQSDRELTRAMQTGDRQALEEIYLKYAEEVRRVAGDDAVQTVFVRLLNCHVQIKNIRAYLYRAAKNAAHDLRRHATVKLPAIEGGCDPSTIAECNEQLNNLTAAIGTLPPVEQATIQDYLANGPSEDTTVRKRVQRVKEKLRRILMCGGSSRKMAAG
jgi:DNA-directed RNA polymerase specialized sigma24 family protein